MGICGSNEPPKKSKNIQSSQEKNIIDNSNNSKFKTNETSQKGESTISHDDHSSRKDTGKNESQNSQNRDKNETSNKQKNKSINKNINKNDVNENLENNSNNNKTDKNNKNNKNNINNNDKNSNNDSIIFDKNENDIKLSKDINFKVNDSKDNIDRNTIRKTDQLSHLHYSHNSRKVDQSKNIDNTVNEGGDENEIDNKNVDDNNNNCPPLSKPSFKKNNPNDEGKKYLLGSQNEQNQITPKQPCDIKNNNSNRNSNNNQLPNNESDNQQSNKFNEENNSIKEINHSKRISNMKIKNYSRFQVDKDYYLCCPECNICIPHIYNFHCDINKKDFNIDYICPCKYPNVKKIAYFSALLTEEEPKNLCPKHSNKELLYFCLRCNIQICNLCKNQEHQNHEYDLKNKILSKENAKKMRDIAERFNFKGFAILQKLYNSYFENGDDINGESFGGNNSRSQINILQGQNEMNYNKSVNLNHGNELEKKKSENVSIQINNPNPYNQKSNDDFNQNVEIEKFEELKFINYNNNHDDLEDQYNDNYNNIPNLNNSLLSKNLFSNRHNNSYNDGDFILDHNNIKNNDNIHNEPKNYKNTKTFKSEDKIISLIQLISGDIAAGSEDSKVRIWDINTEECILEFYELGKVHCLLEFEPNKLLVGTSENNIGLWDLEQVIITKNNGKIPNSVFNFIQHDKWVNCLVKYNNRWFASASNDGKIIMWDYYERKSVFELNSDDSVLALIKLNDGNLCSGGDDTTIKIWDINTKTCVKCLVGHEKFVKSLCQLSNGTILSGADDTTIKVWKNNDVECACTLNEHQHSVRTLCQIDNNYFASGSFDNRIIIWDIQTMKYVCELNGHSSNVICIIKLKDNRLCSCSMDRTIKIWE